MRDLKRRASKCLRQGIRLTSIGRRDRMPEQAVRELQRIEAETARCENMTLCLALDYGGTWDILQVAENVRRMMEEGRCPPGPFTQEAMAELLGSGSVPPSDLLIRTGGDSRTSNFLPWQLNYAELMFVSKLWPDFCEADLLEF